jgi:hypothetical protein
MGTLNSTKYGLVTRALNSSQDVLPNDTALVVSLLSGSVTLTLNQIPDNSWQTSYKLYVSISAMKGAGETLIINAGSGQKINGQQTLVLDNIDYIAVIRVSSNNTYIAQLNYVQSNAIAVYDEGVLLTSAATSIDFTGTGVTATNVAGAVEVDVPNVVGGFVAVVSLTSKTLPIASASTRRIANGTVFNTANSLGYDTVLEYGSFAGASTFNATTGVWTCPTTGYYDITVFLGLIANANPNENAITPNYWQGNGTANADLEIISGTITSGSLVVGNRYTIRTYVAGDNFVNVGGTNVTGNTFIATGTNPTVYSNASTLDWIKPQVDFDEYIGSFGVCAEAAGTIYCQQHVPVYFNNSCVNISGTYTGRYVAAGTQISCRFLNKTQLIGGNVSGSSFHFTVKRVY